MSVERKEYRWKGLIIELNLVSEDKTESDQRSTID